MMVMIIMQSAYVFAWSVDRELFKQPNSTWLSTRARTACLACIAMIWEISFTPHIYTHIHSHRAYMRYGMAEGTACATNGHEQTCHYLEIFADYSGENNK